MNKKGFTIIEILITLAIVGILGAGVLGLQYILGQNQLIVWRNYLNVNAANRNVTSIVREIRTAQISESGSYPLELAQDAQVVFYTDIDFDGVVERVRYFLAGSNFSRGIIEPTGQPATYPSGDEKVKVLTENVRNGATPVFYYYNGGWPEDTVNNPLTTPSSPSEVKLIRVYLRLNTEENEPDKDFILESFTQLRMLKENL